MATKRETLASNINITITFTKSSLIHNDNDDDDDDFEMFYTRKLRGNFESKLTIAFHNFMLMNQYSLS